MAHPAATAADDADDAMDCGYPPLRRERRPSAAAATSSERTFEPTLNFTPVYTIARQPRPLNRDGTPMFDAGADAPRGEERPPAPPANGVPAYEPEFLKEHEMLHRAHVSLVRPQTLGRVRFATFSPKKNLVCRRTRGARAHRAGRGEERAREPGPVPPILVTRARGRPSDARGPVRAFYPRLSGAYEPA